MKKYSKGDKVKIKYLYGDIIECVISKCWKNGNYAVLLPNGDLWLAFPSDIVE